MAGRPRLSDDIRRVRVQVFLEPIVVEAANRMVALTGAPLSHVIARMARAGARQTVIDMVAEQKKGVDLILDPEPTLTPETPDTTPEGEDE